MYGFWLLLFLTKLYSHTGIFKNLNTLKRSTGKIYLLSLTYLSAKTKYAKILLDMTFIKTCKKEHIIPTFGNTKLSIKGTNNKFKHCIIRITMEDEMT